MNKRFIDSPLEIPFKKMNNDAIEPTRAHDWDAGFDLRATSIKETPEYVQYGTAIAFQIPVGYVGFIVARSSVTKRDLILKNSLGVIDAGYIGEVFFRFYKNIVEEIDKTSEVYDTLNGRLIENHFKVLNHKKTPNIYKVGDDIGQIIFIKLPQIKLKEVNELKPTERGDGGFGSSDEKKKI